MDIPVTQLSSASMCRIVTMQRQRNRYDLYLRIVRALINFTKVFILDERTHPGKSIVDPDLRGSQGPALIAINDGLLSERDWEALKSINSSSKKADET